MIAVCHLNINIQGDRYNSKIKLISVVLVSLSMLWVSVLTSFVLANDYAATYNVIISNSIYTNQDYLYSVMIPEGIQVTSNSPPSPNHGFRATFTSNHDDFIVIDGSYNSADYLSPSDYINRSYILPITTSGAKITDIKLNPSVLGGLPAQRMSLKYNPAGDNKVVVMDIIAAFRQPAHDTEMIYTLALTSSPATYDGNREVFEMMLSSWTCAPDMRH